MADSCITIFLDADKQKRLADVGLADQFKDIDGKKAVQVAVTQKEQKKLAKGFPELAFDTPDKCVLPEAAENTLVDMIVSTKTLDVMKVAILKLYNPLAGKGLRERL
jgi:hypothetical protein